MNDLIYKSMELKEVSEAGTFRGIASIYGVEDLGNDVIMKGAMTKTLSENPTVPLLWQHRSGDVIGEVTLKEWQGKVMADGALDMEDPDVKSKYYGKMKRRLVKGLSIGFQVVKDSFVNEDGKSIRQILELKLWELSVVTFPMLPGAQITSVKSDDELDLEAKLAMANEQIKALLAENATAKAAGEAAAAAATKALEPVSHSRALYLIEKYKLGLAS